MPLPSMRARLISSVMAGNSWGTYGGGGSYISEARAVEIVDGILSALRLPDVVMLAVEAQGFTAMIDAVRAQRPKAHIVGSATITVGDYPVAEGPAPMIGKY